MAASTTPAPTQHEPHGSVGPVAHHFNNLAQQQQTQRFGMWLFLVTEVLFFGGAFCAYTVYRIWFPKDFEAGSAALNVGIASVNTFLLLASSLTITLAIRSCYTSDRKGLVRNLAFTILLGTAFLGLKAREYYLDVEEGLVPNVSRMTTHAAHEDAELREKLAPLVPRLTGLIAAENGKAYTLDAKGERKVADPLAAFKAGEYAGLLQRVEVKLANAPVAFNENVAAVLGHQKPFVGRRADYISAEEIEAGMKTVGGATSVEDGQKKLADEEAKTATAARNAYDPNRVQLFFMFYYSMTGLHVLHMIVGLGLLAWQLVLALIGFFDYSARYVYIETMSLYWHFVDMAWMFLLPLLYLAGPHSAAQAMSQFGEALGMGSPGH